VVSCNPRMAGRSGAAHRAALSRIAISSLLTTRYERQGLRLVQLGQVVPP
jgi:hypothetical protein